MKTVHAIILASVCCFAAFLIGQAVEASGNRYLQNVVINGIENEVGDASVKHADVGYFQNGQIFRWRFAGERVRLFTENGREYMVLTAAPYNADGGTLSAYGAQFRVGGGYTATAGEVCTKEGLLITQSELNADITYQCCTFGNKTEWVKGVCHPDGG